MEWIIHLVLVMAWVVFMYVIISEITDQDFADEIKEELKRPIPGRGIPHLGTY